MFQEVTLSFDTYRLLGCRSFGEVPSIYTIGLLLTTTSLVSLDWNTMYIGNIFHRRYVRPAVDANLVIAIGHACHGDATECTERIVGKYMPRDYI
jgi:hypothetical protein